MANMTRDDARDHLPLRIANAEARIQQPENTYEYVAKSLLLVLILDDYIAALGPSSYDLDAQEDRDLLAKAIKVRNDLNDEARTVLRALRTE